MERVAFLVDSSGERIDCLLNPETVEVTRLAGVRPRGTANGHLTGAGLADDPLQFTGGGRTELVLDLLFDVDLVETQVRPVDVRALTRRLWMLAENSAEERGAVRPPLVRLVWGKTWNVPGVIVAVAERFDAFTIGGTPRRSWLRMKLVRVTESAAQAQAAFDAELAAAATPVPAQPSQPGALPSGAVMAIGDGEAEPGYTGVRFDQLANDALGSPLRWRLLAEYNRIANPFDVAPGTPLGVPPGLSRPAAGSIAAGASGTASTP
jgi:nucleoid-associated protein YgaU